MPHMHPGVVQPHAATCSPQTCLVPLLCPCRLECSAAQLADFLAHLEGAGKVKSEERKGARMYT